MQQVKQFRISRGDMIRAAGSHAMPGDLAQATAELGERLLDIVAESVARFLSRIGEETGSGKAR